MSDKSSRGFRNNNPANIKRSASKWAYMRKVQSDKKFCQFLEMKYGVRAFFLLMRTYRYKYGLKTVGDIIRRFAPPSENRTDNYLSFLSSHLLPPDLSLSSDALYCIFAKWVFRYESNFVCSVDWLKEIMDLENCHVVNPLKEYHEACIF